MIQRFLNEQKLCQWLETLTTVEVDCIGGSSIMVLLIWLWKLNGEVFVHSVLEIEHGDTEVFYFIGEYLNTIINRNT